MLESVTGTGSILRAIAARNFTREFNRSAELPVRGAHLSFEQDNSYECAFPLTPPLSLGERGIRILRRKFNVLVVPKRGKRFSLSPRERAGVRGKGETDGRNERSTKIEMRPSPRSSIFADCAILRGKVQ